MKLGNVEEKLANYVQAKKNYDKVDEEMRPFRETHKRLVSNYEQQIEENNKITIDLDIIDINVLILDAKLIFY